MNSDWPDIPYAPWRDTCSALHLYAQVVGKYRLACTPWINHSWHATFYMDARGFTTGLVPDGPGGVEISFDLLGQRLTGAATDGRRAEFALEPMSVAEFHRRFSDMLHSLGATTKFDGRPNELPDAIPFTEDLDERPYDDDAVRRYFRALISVDLVLKHFRTGFLGKASAAHLFWGSFDLAVTRFSGHTAPRHPGGVPALPDAVTCEAYSHEESSAGFWPGGAGVDFPAFYSYAYPAPDGFAKAQVRPDAAYYDTKLGEFLLPYDAVRRSSDPEATLMAFLMSTYSAAADLGGWDRSTLECPIGSPRHPRPV